MVFSPYQSIPANVFGANGTLRNSPTFLLCPGSISTLDDSCWQFLSCRPAHVLICISESRLQVPDCRLCLRAVPRSRLSACLFSWCFCSFCDCLRVYYNFPADEMSSNLKLEAKHEKILKDLVKLPDNRRCADCDSLVSAVRHIFSSESFSHQIYFPSK